ELVAGAADVQSAVPAGGVVDKVKRASIGGPCGLCFPTAGIDGCPWIVGRSPVFTFAPGNGYIATPQAIGSITAREKEVFPVRRTAMGAFIVQVCIYLPL